MLQLDFQLQSNKPKFKSFHSERVKLYPSLFFPNSLINLIVICSGYLQQTSVTWVCGGRSHCGSAGVACGYCCRSCLCDISSSRGFLGYGGSRLCCCSIWWWRTSTSCVGAPLIQLLNDICFVFTAIKREHKGMLVKLLLILQPGSKFL